MNKIYFLTTITAIIISILSLVYTHLTRPKLAYVRSQELIYGYTGTIEARKEFDEKKEKWQANADTLRAEFRRSLDIYNKQSNAMSEPENKKRQKALAEQERQLMNYENAINNKIKEEDQLMMQGILNQINSFIEEYGKKNNYDILLGTTVSGSLLYGRKGIDVTQDLLEKLNENYNGK